MIEDFMEKLAVVEMYFNTLLQQEINETMNFFEDKNLSKAGIFEALMIELVLRARQQGVTIEKLNEMILASYEDKHLKHFTTDDFEEDQ